MLSLSRTYSREGKESEDRQIMDFLRYSNVLFNPDGSMYCLISRARDLYFQGSPYVTESLDFSLVVCHHKIRAHNTVLGLTLLFWIALAMMTAPS